MSAEVAQAENVNLAPVKDLPSGVENAVTQPDVAAEGNKGDTTTNKKNDPILASSTDQKANEVDTTKEQENGTAEDKMDVDQKQAESHETSNGTSAKIDTAQEIPGSESATAKEDLSSAIPESAAALEEKKEKEVPAPSHVETNGTEQVAPAVQPPPPTSVLPSDETAVVGEKRKAAEQASAEETAEAGKSEENGEHDAKKPKVAEEAPETNNGESAPTEPVKRKPGRPPKSANGAAKKEKKVPAVGRSERKTRSQGGV